MVSDAPRRIAMWSGPRNLSTALMRAFENRPDTEVVDEPLYGVYLSQTGAPHPDAAGIIAAMETDWRAVVARLCGPSPDGAPVWYQKHMAHHLVAGVDRGWIGRLSNVLLIRSPRRVVASYAKRREGVVGADLGYAQLLEVDELVTSVTGTRPLVIDADRLLAAPQRVLETLCGRLGLPFYPEMLGWPAGPRDSDGVWAPHWYRGVWDSTGFRATPGPTSTLPPSLMAVVEEVQPAYEVLRARAL